MAEPTRPSSHSAASASTSPPQSRSSLPTPAPADAPQPNPPSHKRKRSSPTATSTSAPPQEASDLALPSTSAAPPLPSEPTPPPLPDEPLPVPVSEDDGWAPIWDANAQAFYFYNRFTQASQWENPRVPDPNLTSTTAGAPGTSTGNDKVPGASANTSAAGLKPTSTALGKPPTSALLDNSGLSILPAAAGGYNPAIHGSYDPNADYAQLPAPASPPLASQTLLDPSSASNIDPAYASSANFNRFTGRFQAASIAPENLNDENKSKRQMNAYFDVDAAANSHDGRSLKAERAGKKLSKSEVKAFREKRKERKEEKRRAWLRD